MGRTGKGSFKKKNYFKLKDGDAVFRILPPLAELATVTDIGNLPLDKRWSRYHSIHFGYKNSEGKLRTFLSPLEEKYDRETKTRTVIAPDPALNRLNDFKAKLERAKEEKNAPLVAKLETLVGPQGSVYSLDKNEYMNVVDLQGNIGVLKIRYKAKLALDVEIQRLEKQGVDPLSIESGRYFRFTRTGRGNDTTFKVTEYLEESGDGYKKVVSKLTPDILSRIKYEAVDLSKMAPKLSSEEVAEIVNTSEVSTGKTVAVDKYIDARRKAANDDNYDDPNEQEAQANKPPVVTPVKASAPVTPVQAATPAPAAVATPAPVTPVTPTKATQSPLDMPDDEFWEQMDA